MGLEAARSGWKREQPANGGGNEEAPFVSEKNEHKKQTSLPADPDPRPSRSSKLALSSRPSVRFAPSVRGRKTEMFRSQFTRLSIYCKGERWSQSLSQSIHLRLGIYGSGRRLPGAILKQARQQRFSRACYREQADVGCVVSQTYGKYCPRNSEGSWHSIFASPARVSRAIHVRSESTLAAVWIPQRYSLLASLRKDERSTNPTPREHTSKVCASGAKPTNERKAGKRLKIQTPRRGRRGSAGGTDPETGPTIEIGLVSRSRRRIRKIKRRIRSEEKEKNAKTFHLTAGRCRATAIFPAFPRRNERERQEVGRRSTRRGATSMTNRRQISSGSGLDVLRGTRRRKWRKLRGMPKTQRRESKG